MQNYFNMIIQHGLNKQKKKVLETVLVNFEILKKVLKNKVNIDCESNGYGCAKDYVFNNM